MERRAHEQNRHTKTSKIAANTNEPNYNSTFRISSNINPEYSGT
jgi:hypothetical protein